MYHCPKPTHRRLLWPASQISSHGRGLGHQPSQQIILRCRAQIVSSLGYHTQGVDTIVTRAGMHHPISIDCFTTEARNSFSFLSKSLCEPGAFS